MRRRRSKRSYVVEVLFVAAVVLGLYLFMTNGGPAWLGEWFAGAMVDGS